MNRLAALFIIVPASAMAQQASVEPNQVYACFEQALPGQIAPPCIGAAAQSCQRAPGMDTTLGMSECIQAETAIWDEILNTQYRSLRSELGAENADLPIQLRDAQRAWIAFRDAECGLRYSLWSGGSIRVIVAANCHLTETAERALELRDLGSMQ